ncbi:uncharacterized protein LOC112054968 [Bicyclus anynana]|uniref:Uncharacterized protein LOC112054968 n=1 Tax=Bicyclus anynana TaxID=110368 RepID=A0ABM3LT25_BICAN|nr:uncharacterized protein LOC112054968 [Bicyclus anynana]XP_052742212.1 uncharacterized protein LOC112054968 [Bicyclus anynana]
MRLEIPECRRCCCCVPLRHGILVFGYLNLAFSIFVVVVEILVLTKGSFSYHTMTVFRGLQFYVHLWFAVLLYASEIIFNIVLLVGAHMRKPQLMRVYYWYGIATTAASAATFLVLWLKMSCKHCHWTDYVIEVSFLASGVGIQIYLLLLIRSALRKFKHNSRLCYVNHASEIMVESPLQTGHNPF